MASHGELQVKAKAAKKFKATTDSDHDLPVAPNLLDQDFGEGDWVRFGW